VALASPPGPRNTNKECPLSNRTKRLADARRHNAKRGGVVVAYLHGSEVAARFSRSLIDLMIWDGKHDGHIVNRGGKLDETSGGNIIAPRNKVVREFLAIEDLPGVSAPQWLWLIDADMEFPADTLDRLLAVADPETAPIVGGLCFALVKGDAREVQPTLYVASPDGQELVKWFDYPPDQMVQVMATGAACLLVHRSVLAAMAEKFTPPFPFFDNTPTGTGWGDSLSEDITFCRRAAACGFPIHVDTSIKIGHVKTVVVDEAMYLANRPQPRAAEPPAPTYVVIPIKGKHHFTKSLLDQLRAQGGADHVFVYDNGADTDPYIDALDENVTLIPSPGKSIYEMWNLGIKAALDRDARCNIAVLNNDLILGDDFLTRLAAGLRSDGFVAVCGNYDRRDFPGQVQVVQGIAAGREDGTGGIAGFAFMVRGEIFGAGCPMFDEQYEIWWGDTDWFHTLDQAGAAYGVVKDAHVTHIGGGSQTAGDGKNRLAKEWEAPAARDRERFVKKWTPRRIEQATAGPGELR
jgi:hypothetical protein